MREKYRKSIASLNKFPQFTTMNVIDGQAGLISYTSLIFYSLTIDNILNIIVLLILAGVSIAMLTGDNGILNQATDAEKKTTLAEYEEHRRLLEQEAYIEEHYSTEKTELTEAEATAQGWSYNLESNFITKYDGTDSTVYIPNKIGNVQMNKISLLAFWGNTTAQKIIFHGDITDEVFCSNVVNLKEVIMKDGITKLGSFPFNSCLRLEYIVLPSTLTNISNYGLGNLGIRNIVIPKSVTTVGDNIFIGCKNPITIHCEAELPEGKTVPDGWSDKWLDSAPEGTTVDWGYKR